MGVVTVSSSAARTTLGSGTRFSGCHSAVKKPLIVAFKGDKSNNTELVPSHVQIPLPIETPTKERLKTLGKGSKPSKKVKGALTDEASPSTLEVDYNEAAAKLENIYKLSPTTYTSDGKDIDGVRRKGQQRRKNSEGNDKADNRTGIVVVGNPKKKAKRMNLDKRIALRKNKEEKVVASTGRKRGIKEENEKIHELLSEFSDSTHLTGFDWKTMKIPPVLPSPEQAWLFKLMQPMKAIFQVKEQLQKDLGREPTEVELGEMMSASPVQLRKQIEIGQAARNKLIKHNLRLVLFAINKYFQVFANSPNFQDLCQAGVKGLITAIDRFDPKRRFRLSTYSLFWVRHTIVRSMTVSSFMRVSFGLGAIRVEIQRVKLDLLFELGREPTKEEIIKRMGISPKRYEEVMRASAHVLSLNSRHAATQEELINGITDDGGVGDDKWRQTALLRLALDDVLDSLKPKESLVIRQRYGLDGKGNRTLGEIAGNLNISREMVRKYEVKALMKLRLPARMDYLRRYIVV